jgi:hypothetical protein
VVYHLYIHVYCIVFEVRGQDVGQWDVRDMVDGDGDGERGMVAHRKEDERVDHPEA